MREKKSAKKGKLNIIGNVLGIIIIVTIIILMAIHFFCSNTVSAEEENWKDYINSQIDSTQCDYEVEEVNIEPNCFNKIYKDRETITIATKVRWNNEMNYEYTSVEEQKAAINIRDIVQDYIVSYSGNVFEIDSSKHIILLIQSMSEPTFGRQIFCNSSYVYATFGNQYDPGIGSYCFNKEKINSLLLDSVYVYDVPRLTEEELKLFSDAKSIIFSAKSVNNFSFLEKFSKLKYIAITDFEDWQLDECAKHLPDGCELLTNFVTKG